MQKRSAIAQSLLVHPIKLVTGLLREMYVRGIIVSNTAKASGNADTDGNKDSSQEGFLLSKNFVDSHEGIGLAPYFCNLMEGQVDTPLRTLIQRKAAQMIEWEKGSVSPNEIVAVIHLVSVGLCGGTSKGWEAAIRVTDDDDISAGQTAAADSQKAEENKDIEDDGEAGEVRSAGVEVRVHLTPSEPGQEDTEQDAAHADRKEKVLIEYSGHYDKAMQRMHVSLRIDKTAPLAAPDEQESKESGPTDTGESNPWRTESELKTLFTAKVLSVLASRPGSALLDMRRSLEVLDERTTLLLLEELGQVGLICRRRASRTLTALQRSLRDPFAAKKMLFSSRMQPSQSLEEEDSEWRYFLAL